MTSIMDAPQCIEPMQHIPVLCRDVVALFNFPGKAVLVDGTLSLGGHAAALLKANPGLTLIGLDCDPQALSTARENLAPFGTRFLGLEASYADLTDVLAAQNLPTVDGLFLDLGVSSCQLRDDARGFSFASHGPLDMRMGPTVSSRTAWEIVADTDLLELTRIFRVFGEERYAHRIARALKETLRRNELTNDAVAVARVIQNAIPVSAQRIDPATRCFQALRIAVNHELDHLRTFLDSARDALAPGGRVAILAYHSLEDRMVKQAFQAAVHGCVCPPRAPRCVCGQKPWARRLLSKAKQADAAEVADNPRARSARLRALEKLSQ